MNLDLALSDPLVIFRCKNKQCRQIFTPSPIMNDAENKIYFECPICASKYEAQYTDTNLHSEHKSIMLVERPKMVYLGTRIASS